MESCILLTSSVLKHKCFAPKAKGYPIQVVGSGNFSHSLCYGLSTQHTMQ